MTTPPAQPKIYHITHVDNLPGIAREGLVSDREMIERGGPAQAIGMSEIKRRRVKELEVSCHPGTRVGDYVPFFFCPRSVMLYVIYRANHPKLEYRGGQGPIVHLEADLKRVIDWAEASGVRWAFSSSNAGAWDTEFWGALDHLGELDWSAIRARNFWNPEVQERKQAEFLVYERFPFDLVERIGVQSQDVQERACQAIALAVHQPPIQVLQHWYY